MGQLDARGDLSAAAVAFFAPALIISLVVVARHGFSRQAGWLYLLGLSILRLIGASCILYIETQNDYSESLLICAAITSAVGTAPLLLALLGFLERIHWGMGGHGFSSKIFMPLHLGSILALVLAIIGGTYESSNSSASEMSTGRSLMEAASFVFLVIYLSLTGITVLTQRRKSYMLSTEHKLLYAGLAALPFLLVRIIFTVIVSFSKPGSDFYFRNVDVWASAFMQFLIEAIVVALFIAAGLMTPKQVVKQSERQEHDYEIVSGPNPNRVRDMENGRAQQQPQPQARYEQPRSLGDYRPSRLVRNAISGRR